MKISEQKKRNTKQSECSVSTFLQGGFWAVIWTDVVHLSGLVIGYIVLMAVGSSQLGGFDQVMAVVNRHGDLKLDR